MSRRFLLIVVLFLDGLLPGAPVSAQDFVIDSFHADILIYNDSELTVQETIAVAEIGGRGGSWVACPISQHYI